MAAPGRVRRCPDFSLSTPAHQTQRPFCRDTRGHADDSAFDQGVFVRFPGHSAGAALGGSCRPGPRSTIGTSAGPQERVAAMSRVREGVAIG
jgi:hypothetical protein